MKHVNSMKDIPLAACGACGGWTSYGGCSQYFNSTEPVYGRTGCTCRNAVQPSDLIGDSPVVWDEIVRKANEAAS